ncbi:DUF3800 domain-containing protein [Ruminococcaceae bacterium OttesenSCG-928-A16]|nr:DUF3800 domain-containing protein [Ruminococcaceae bacterium OttesenSCG-928-A16]
MVVNDLQYLYFFFDDSGCLHTNEESGWFVYAGYTFMNKDDLDIAKRRYIGAMKKIRKETGRDNELKSFGLSNKHRRSLYNVLRPYDTLSVSVDIGRMYPHVMQDKKSICRFKDYALKRIIKLQVQSLVAQKKILANQPITMYVYIDEQLTASNGYYGLKESIQEELCYGIFNHDYGTQYPPVLRSSLEINLHFCDSKYNYLIQASDIVANRIWTSYRINKPELRKISNHTGLTLP